jgi:hypothetical protein
MSLPEGLVYREAFVSADEEADLLGLFEAMEFHTLAMRGQTAKRTVRHFGLRYDYEAGELATTDPLPDGLVFLKARWSWQHLHPRHEGPALLRDLPDAQARLMSSVRSSWLPSGSGAS